MNLDVSDLSEELPTGLLIDGSWINDTAGGTMQHTNPATGDVQCIFPVAGPPEIDLAVRSAREGLERYEKWTAADRRDLLLRIARSCRDRSEEFARLSTLECGMIASMAKTMGDSVASWLEYYAGWTDKVVGEVAPGENFNYTRQEPYGVVAIILTWNGPTGSIGMKVAAAMAAGCAIVLKPPELAPFSSNLFGRLCLENGLPPGVLNVVPGGPEAGTALVEHRNVDKISFTGGPATARKVQAACANSLTPLVMELGGKSANIIFPDADLDRAVSVASQGIVRLAGQACHAPTRLLVHDSVYDTVISGVRESLNSVNVGLPSELSSQMGPVISEAACERILGVIDTARAQEMGRLVAGGDRVGGELSRGFFIRPTAFGEVANDSTLAQNEVFGPVLAIMRFRDEDEAIAIANDSVYGLAAHVHTSNLARAHRVAAKLDVGNVSINGGKPNAGPVSPFGGVKDSGYGKEGGRAGIEEYLRTKNVNINLD